MVDMKTYRKMNPSLPKSDDRPELRRTPYYTSAEMANDEAPSHDTLTFPPIVFGYNLRTKKWRTILTPLLADMYS